MLFICQGLLKYSDETEVTKYEELVQKNPQTEFIFVEYIKQIRNKLFPYGENPWRISRLNCR